VASAVCYHRLTVGWFGWFAAAGFAVLAGIGAVN
jgi:hypothetical protein